MLQVSSNLPIHKINNDSWDIGPYKMISGLVSYRDFPETRVDTNSLNCQGKLMDENKIGPCAWVCHCLLMYGSLVDL